MRILTAGVVAAAAALGAGPAARAQDDALRALGLGLSIINNMQQQQLQQQRRQPAPQQAAPQRQQAPASAARRAPPPQVETAAGRQEREAVREAQALLNRLGYDAGPVDGAPGPRTRNAIAAFRADYGLGPGTAVDAELSGALRVAGRGAPAVAAGALGAGRALMSGGAPLWSEPDPGPASSTVSMEGGAVMVDGRVAAASNGKFDHFGQAIDYMAMAASVERLIFQHTTALTPGAFDDDAVALSAIGLVEPDLAASLLKEALGRSLSKQEANAVARGLAMRDVVRGLESFEEQDVIAVVRANVDRIVPPDLPAPPVPLRVFCQVRLGEYDFETQSFPIYEARGCNGMVRGAVEASVEGPDPVPERLPMAPDEARAFRAAQPERHYLAAFDAELGFVKGGDALSGPILTVTLERLSGAALYAPGSLTEVIHRFGGPAEVTGEPGGIVAGDDGLTRIDGRVLAAASDHFGNFGVDVDSAGLGRALRDLVFSYNLALRPDALDDDEEAFAALEMIDPALAAEVFVEALGRPLQEEERRSYELSGFRMLDGFERKRALDGLRARRDQIVPASLPEPPIPLRILCILRLEAYDFEAQAFPVGWSNGCDEGGSGAQAGLVGLRDLRSVGPRPVPEAIAVPQDQAEAIGDGGDYLASYDALLDFDVRRTEAGSQLIVQLTDRGGLRIHPYGSLTEVLYAAPGSGEAAAAGAPETSEPWVLHDQADIAEMAALAGAPKTFPADGAALLVTAGESLGTIEGPARIRTDDDGKEWPAELFDTYYVDGRLRIATALSVPLDYVVQVSRPSGGGHGIGGMYGLLPAPAGSYSATPPDDLYGERDVRYRWTAAVTGLHAFELPGGSNILLAVLQPVEGRFTTTSDRDPQVLERFDLTAQIPLPEVEPVPADSRAAIALAAAGGGVDPVELLMGLLDKRMTVFDREALAKGLVAAEAEREGPLTSFWTEGTLRLGEYDLKTEAFPVTTAAVGPIDVLRSEDLPPHALNMFLVERGLTIAMDREQARAWSESDRNTQHRVRARFGIEGGEQGNGSVSLKGRFLEIELLAPEAVATRRDPGGVLFRSVPEAEVAATPAVVTRDVLGVTLGSPFEQAVATVTAEIAPSEEYHVTRELVAIPGPPQPTAWEAWTTGRFLHNPERGVSVALFHEPPAAADKVSAIHRSQIFTGGGRPHPDALEAVLIEKYGALTEVEKSPTGVAMTWLREESPSDESLSQSERFAESSCFRTIRTRAKTSVIGMDQILDRRQRAPDGRGSKDRAFWFDANGERWDAPASDTLNLRLKFGDFLGCETLGEVLIALVSLDPDGLASGFQVLLFDTRAAAEAARANEAAAAVAAPKPGGGLDVKL